MKKIIMGYHPEDASKKVYFWDAEKFNEWETKYDYAIVQTSRGMQIAKVIGNGNLEDEMFEYMELKSVLKFFDLEEECASCKL